jgi:hypothetical protein
MTRPDAHAGASRGPILIAGADRSGTSLMYALLASHPTISMVRRTNLWRWFHGRYGDLASPANLDRCLEDLLRYPRLHQLEPDVARLRTEFRAGAPSYGRLFALLHEHHATRRGKARWGDKSLHTEHHVREILADLPEARIIQMVRDPRDRHASVIRRYEDRTKGIGATMGRWVASAGAIVRNQRRYPASVMTVRYEDLAREPEATVRSVCAFVGERYEPSMLRMEGAPDHGSVGGNSSFIAFEPGAISTRSIGRFRDVLPPRDLAFIQAVAGRRMRKLGYELVPVPWASRRERLVFQLGELPVDGARLSGWVTWDRLHGRRQPAPDARLAIET